MSARLIKVGDVFEHRPSQERGRVDTFRREPDDPSPVWGYERILVTHLDCNFGGSPAKPWKPYTFAAEPEWFRQRGFTVEDDDSENAVSTTEGRPMTPPATPTPTPPPGGGSARTGQRSAPDGQPAGGVPGVSGGSTAPDTKNPLSVGRYSPPSKRCRRCGGIVTAPEEEDSVSESCGNCGQVVEALFRP